MIFFRDFLKIKSGASNKQIPSIIFHSSDKCIGSFLYGYFAGDGTVYKNTISVSSVSRKMINELSYLFNLLGFNGRITTTKYNNDNEHKIKNKIVKNKKTQYKFSIDNIDIESNGNIILKEDFLIKKITFPINRFSKRSNKLVSYKCNNYKKLFNDEYSNNTKLDNFVNGDLMMLKIKSINIINPNYEYVYDFSVSETENFIGGWQPMCLHNSTIEGGMVCTNDEELYNILLSVRSHGWSRDLEKDEQIKLKNKYNISDFKSLYTFFLPGFNIRSTDLQAFIGMNQLKKIDNHNKIRNKNYILYHNNIDNDYWKIKNYDDNYISNFAYPIISPKINDIVSELTKNNVESRPLICGNIGNQPFWIDIYGKQSFDFADKVDNYGLYLPNNHQITEEQILFICDIINKKLTN